MFEYFQWIKLKLKRFAGFRLWKMHVARGPFCMQILQSNIAIW